MKKWPLNAVTTVIKTRFNLISHTVCTYLYVRLYDLVLLSKYVCYKNIASVMFLLLICQFCRVAIQNCSELQKY